MSKYADVLRAITGVLAFVLLIVVFVTSTLQGTPPSDDIMRVLVPLITAYFGTDILSAVKANKSKQE